MSKRKSWSSDAVGNSSEDDSTENEQEDDSFEEELVALLKECIAKLDDLKKELKQKSSSLSSLLQSTKLDTPSPLPPS